MSNTDFDFSDAGQWAKQQGLAAKTQAVSGIDANPDNAAKAVNLAPKVGAPATAIDPDLERWARQQKATEASTAVETNPAIKGYVLSHAMASKVSNDDWGNLDKTSRAATDTLAGSMIHTLLGFYHNNRGLFGGGDNDLAKAAKEGAQQGFGGEPLGIDPVKYPLFYRMWQPFVAPLDFALRAPGAAIGAGSKVGATLYQNFGGGEADAARLERDLNILGTGAMIEAGTRPNEVAVPKAKEVEQRPLTPEAQASLAAGEIPRPGADPTFDELHVQQQKLDAIKLSNLVAESDKDLTKQRSPEMEAEFLRQHGQGNETISVPAEKIVELSEGKAPSEGPFGWMPGVDDLVKRGLETGEEVKLPLAEYVANTNSAMHEKLKDSIRFRPEGVTGEEAKELADKEETVTLYRTEGGEKAEGVVEPYAGEGKFFTDDAETRKFIQNASAEAKEEAVRVSTTAIQQRRALYLDPLIKDAKTLGLTDSEFKRYSDKIEQSQNEIITRAIAAAEREVKKPLTEEWKKNEKAVRQEVEKEFGSRREIVADQLLRSGKVEGRAKTSAPTFLGKGFEGAKLDAKSVEAALGKEHAIGDLVAAKGGLDPDLVATVTGFNSGKEMLKALNEFNYGRTKLGMTPKRYYDAIVQRETDARMRQRYGLLPENILAEARDIATHDLIGELLSDDIKYLARKGGFDLPISADVLRAKAKDDFQNLQLHRVPTEAEVRRAIEKNGRNAEKALLKGKIEDALKAKLAQRQAFWTLRELKAFQKEQTRFDTLVKRIGKDETVGRVDSMHVMQARRVLDSLGVKSGAYPEGLESLSNFVQAADGQIAAAQWLVLGEKLRTSLDQLNVQEFKELKDTLQSIMHVGRDVKMIDTAFAQAELENVVNDIRAELARFNTLEQPLSGANIKQRAGAIGRSVASAFLLPERILDYTDQFNPNGPLSRWLDRPLREAFARKLKYQEQLIPDIKELGKYVDSSVTDLIDNKLIRDPLAKGLDNEFLQMNHWNLRKMMLYMGSRSGMEKVIRGFFQSRGAPKLDPMEMDFLQRKMIDFVNEHATENDVKFVNKIFSIHDKLLPDIKKLQLEDTGLPMEEVKAVPYETKYGTVTGGYTKLRYDRDRSSIEEDLRSKKSYFEDGYRQITTPHSFTKERTGYSGFLDLDMTLFASEMESQIHDLSFRKAVRNAAKLIDNPEFMMEMRQKWGTQYADLFPQWLRDIANSNTINDDYARGFIRVSKEFRKNVVNALVGFNPGTAEKHGISAAGMSIKEVGAKDFVTAARDAVKDAKDLAKQVAPSNPEFADYLRGLTTERGMRQFRFALESSPILRNRMMRWDQTLYGAFKDATTASRFLSGFRTLREWSGYAGRWPISALDTLSTVPEWLAAYKREFENSGDHDTAVYAADKAVSRSHGSAFTGDAPAILRQKNNTVGGEVVRWFTPLYRFWNHNFNMLAGLKWDTGAAFTGRAEPGGNPKSIANSLFWIAVIPIVAEEMATPALDQRKHSSVLEAIGRYLGGQIPFLRDITNAFLQGNEPSVGLLGSAAHMMTLAAHNVSRGTNNAWSSFITGLAMLTGIGSQPLGKASQYGLHVLEGKETPHNLPQIEQGLRTGSQRPRRY